MPLGRSASTSAFISAGVNRDHSVRSTCGGRVNRADQRRGTIGAHENRVQLPRQIDIGGVAAGAGDEAAVFAPAGEGVRDHGAGLGSLVSGAQSIRTAGKRSGDAEGASGKEVAAETALHGALTEWQRHK